MGGGTLAAKVAEKIANERAATASANEPSDPAPPHSPPPPVAASRHQSTPVDSDYDAPDWIDTASEDAYLGEQAQAAAFAQANAPRASDDEDDDDKSASASGKELPPMDTLLARIPAGTRQALEDLFRARFVKVSKIPRRSID